MTEYVGLETKEGTHFRLWREANKDEALAPVLKLDIESTTHTLQRDEARWLATRINEMLAAEAEKPVYARSKALDDHRTF